VGIGCESHLLKTNTVGLVLVLSLLSSHCLNSLEKYLGKNFLENYAEIQYYPAEKCLMEKRCKTTNVIPCTTSEVCLLRVSCLYAAFEALKKRKTNTMAKNVLQLGENKIRILRSIEDYIFNKS